MKRMQVKETNQLVIDILGLPKRDIKNLSAMWVQSLGRVDSPGAGNDNPLQYSCLESPMDRGAW